MYSFKYILIDKLPKLAWLAEIKKDDKEVLVLHGKAVECKEKFFVSGVWDGLFEDGNFDDSSVFWGTGAKIESGCLKFVTPSHALERLVSIEEDNRIIISNSFPFILAYSNYELDNKIDQYEAIMCSMVFGLKKMKESIPMDNGKYVKQHMASIISVDDDYNINKYQRKPIEDFKSYEDYYNRLLNALTLIRSNSISEDRMKTKYGLVSTISSGYDSSTCSAMAKKIGCDTVLTLKNGKYDKDSGKEIAEQLGYENIIIRDCFDYKKREDCIEAEYLSSGEVGTQLQFSVFEDALQDKLAFFGVRGCYWEKDDTTTDDFEMHDHFFCEADVSWTENALKNGYIVAPMATYASSNFTSINKITVSKEMEPWTLGGNYDKPIPRRILEESGVDRDAFGKTKYGGGFSFWYDTKKTLKNKMSNAGYDSFTEFLNNTKEQRCSFKRLISAIKFFYAAFPIYINAAARKFGISLPINIKVLKISNPGAPSDLIFWGVDIMTSKYKEILRQYGN